MGLDPDDYYWIEDPQPVVGTFDEEGKLTVANWYLIDEDYFNTYAEEGSTVFTPVNTAISTVVADENAPVEYFNLQGVRVDASRLTRGIYVKRHGANASTIMVK